MTPLAPAQPPSFPLQHPYFEVVYGPLLGPTSVFLARNLGRRLTAAGRPITINPLDLALELGVRSSHTDPLGRRAPLRHALDRLAHHHIVRWLGPTDLGLDMAVPPISSATLAKLPFSVVRAHEAFVRGITGEDLGRGS